MMGHPQGAKLTLWMKEEAEAERGNGDRRMARKEGGPAIAAVTWSRMGPGVEEFTIAEENAMRFLGVSTTHPTPPPTSQQQTIVILCVQLLL